ncbi:MAG: O-antigen ligase family protein [Thermoanaerobaculia bacterium]
MIVAGVILIPLWVSPTGEDSFRYPKELLFRAEAILLAASGLLALIPTPSLCLLKKIPRSLLLLCGAFLGWTGISAVFSTHRQTSFESFWWTLACCLVFLVSVSVLRDRSRGILFVALAPAIVNATVAIGQATGHWHPVALTQESGRLAIVGLLGNPDDLGAFLVLPAVLALASIRSHRQVLRIIAAAILTAGIIVAASITAIAALTAGSIALLLCKWGRSRTALGVGFLVVVLIGSLMLEYQPVRTRFRTFADNLESGNFERMSSNRLSSTLVGITMFADRPLLGQGPGTFGRNYFQFRNIVDVEYADFLQISDPMKRLRMNFAEAHNDFIEVAAETGIPGLMLFITALVWFWRNRHARTSSLVQSGVDQPAFIVAAIFALIPLFAGMFPLQLAATTSQFIFLSATVVSGPRHEEQS